MTALRIQTLGGGEIESQLDALARLRIGVFREWPYLYEGSLDYEAHYLAAYARCPRSLAVLVWDGAHCVGASTALPLADAMPDMQQPWREHHQALDRIDYFGESLLLKPYRGQGLGVEFFARREAHARSLGLSVCAFCAVERDAGDRRRPPDYVGNDAFWTRRGYRKQPQLVSMLSWPDIGEAGPTPKRMGFWLRQLDNP